VGKGSDMGRAPAGRIEGRAAAPPACLPFSWWNAPNVPAFRENSSPAGEHIRYATQGSILDPASYNLIDPDNTLDASPEPIFEPPEVKDRKLLAYQ
jgi:hypothetical protein